MITRFKKLRFIYRLAILIVCTGIFSLILGFPVYLVTKTWSMDTALVLYHRVTNVIEADSSNVVAIDDDGIPYVNYGYKKGVEIGIQRNPLTIATQAISYFNDYQTTQSDETKQYFMNCIQWLEQSKEQQGDHYLWPYEFDMPVYGAVAPIYSAMAQTRIMVAFEKAYELTDDETYLDSANKAMKALDVPISDGGVTYIEPGQDGKWYAELAGGGLETPPRILNGFIYSLLDLNKYYVQTGSQQAKYLFDQGIIALKRNLDKYDTGQWTYYDQLGNLAYDYHYIHVKQMRQLYDITNDELFLTYYEKWNAYKPINPLWARKRFAAYLLDATIVFLILTILGSAAFIITKRIKHTKRTTV